jgi:opacity protein-like surface antigen
MKRSLPMVLVLAVVLLGIAPFAAQAAVPPSAFTLKVGAYFPQEDLDDLEFDTGLNAEVSFTSYFHPNLAAELGIGYFESENDFDFEVTAIPVTLNLKGIIPIGGVELYALGGIGAYYVTFEFPGFDENDTVLGFQAGAGVNFNITPAMFVGAEAKYLWAKPDFGFPVGEIKIDGFQATANLGFRF